MWLHSLSLCSAQSHWHATRAWYALTRLHCMRAYISTCTQRHPCIESFSSLRLSPWAVVRALAMLLCCSTQNRKIHFEAAHAATCLTVLCCTLVAKHRSTHCCHCCRSTRRYVWYEHACLYCLPTHGVPRYRHEHIYSCSHSSSGQVRLQADMM